MGAECETGYTSHVTLVTKKVAKPQSCTTKRDYEAIAGLTTFLPVEEVL